MFAWGAHQTSTSTRESEVASEPQEDADVAALGLLPAANDEEGKQQQQREAVVSEKVVDKPETKSAAQATSPKAGSTPASKKKAKKQRQQQLKREAAEQAAAAEAAAAAEEESAKAAGKATMETTSGNADVPGLEVPPPETRAAEEIPPSKSNTAEDGASAVGTAKSPLAERSAVQAEAAGDASVPSSSPAVETPGAHAADASPASSSSSSSPSPAFGAPSSPPTVRLADLSVDEGAAAAEAALKDWCKMEHGRSQLEAVLTAADKNGDGLLSLREFNSALEAAGCRGATGKQVNGVLVLIKIQLLGSFLIFLKSFYFL